MACTVRAACHPSPALTLFSSSDEAQSGQRAPSQPHYASGLFVGCEPRVTSVQPVARAAAAGDRERVYHRSGSGRGERVNRGKAGQKSTHRHRASMATQTTASCTGSTLLQPISEIINLPLDQVCLMSEQTLFYEFPIEDTMLQHLFCLASKLCLLLAVL